MEMKEQITQEEACARGLMEAEYEQLAKLVTMLQVNPNDGRAFEKFYELTYPRILYTARGLVDNEQSALDVTQEVYIAFYKNIETIRQPRAIISWLHRTATGKAKDMRERASAQNETLLQSEEQEYVFTNTEEHRADFVPHEQMDARATREIISEMLTELPAEQSQTLVYRFVEGLPLAEIAEIMDCTVSTVKSRLKYGKAKIEEQVTAMEKKGIKLYSTSIPMLLACLRWLMAERGALAAEQAAGLLAQVESTVGLTASAAAGAQAAGHTAAAKAGTAAKAGAATKGSAVGTKVVAGVAAAAVIAGGVVGMHKLKAQAQVEPPIAQAVTLSAEQQALQDDYNRNTAYLKVISDLQEEFGVRTQLSDNAYSGLLMAKLVDFDADGTDELLCVCTDDILYTNRGRMPGVNANCWYMVYRWNGTQAEQLTDSGISGGYILEGTNDADWKFSDFYLYQDQTDSKIYLCTDSFSPPSGAPDEDEPLQWQESFVKNTVQDGKWVKTWSATLNKDLRNGSYLSAWIYPDKRTQTETSCDSVEQEYANIRRNSTYYRITDLNDPSSPGGPIQSLPSYPQTPAGGYAPPEDPDILIQAMQQQAEQDKQQLGNAFQEFTADTSESLERLAGKVTHKQMEAVQQNSLSQMSVNNTVMIDSHMVAQLAAADQSRRDRWKAVCDAMLDCIRLAMPQNEYQKVAQGQQNWETEVAQADSTPWYESNSVNDYKAANWSEQTKMYEEHAEYLNVYYQVAIGSIGGLEEHWASENSAAVDPADYIGHWTVDQYADKSNTSVDIYLEESNGQLVVSVDQWLVQWTTAYDIPLTLNEHKTRAIGPYTDSQGNFGAIQLDFENGELYATTTQSGNFGFTLYQNHCTRDS